jgi:hypothetical protein
MWKAAILAIAGLIGALTWTAVPPSAEQRPTLRDALAGAVDLRDFDETFLNSRLPDPEPGRRFVPIDVHINPSAGRLLVFANDFTFVGELWGWQLTALPGDLIVYHKNQVHFAATHSLEIGVFDPHRKIDRQIYPPLETGEVRRAFIARVDQAYRARGEDWFRLKNHPMDPEQFDSKLVGSIGVDSLAESMTFRVSFGGEEPLMFSEVVRVTCSPLAPVERITCREQPAN